MEGMKVYVPFMDIITQKENSGGVKTYDNSIQDSCGMNIF